MMEQKDIYKHYDLDDSCLTLHDCYANRISLENNMISFYFENGFWITPEHESNNLQDVVRTDSSLAEFHLKQEECEKISLYVFQKSIFGKTIRQEWELERLIDLVNNKSFRLEFLEQYKGNCEQIIECWLHFDKKPYFYECQLKIPAQKVVYCWNNLCKDKKW